MVVASELEGTEIFSFSTKMEIERWPSFLGS